FVLESGLPVWRFSKNGIRIEKRVMMPYLQNTTYLIYRLIDGPAGLVLHLRPSLHFRPHEGLLTENVSSSWTVKNDAPRAIEIVFGRGPEDPSLCPRILGDGALERDVRTFDRVLYRLEKSRGYEHEGPLWSPGVIRIPMTRGNEAGLVASVERWDVIKALS